MTRINLVAPESLIDQHLRAEWRELPRIFGLVRKAIAAGRLPAEYPAPAAYGLGKGHMVGFYTRLGFLANRHACLTAECRRRGFQANYPPLRESYADIPEVWWGDWTPTPEDIAVSAARLDQRKLEIAGYKALIKVLKMADATRTYVADTEVTQVRYQDGSLQWVILSGEDAKDLEGFAKVEATSKLKFLNEASTIVRPPEGSIQLEEGQGWIVNRDPFGKITHGGSDV